jgi:hypothetical protein
VVGHQRRICLVDIAPPGETEVREDGGGGQAGGGAARTSQPGVLCKKKFGSRSKYLKHIPSLDSDQ